MTIQSGSSIQSTIEDLRNYDYGTRQSSVAETQIVCMIALLNALDQINQNLSDIRSNIDGINTNLYSIEASIYHR